MGEEKQYTAEEFAEIDRKIKAAKAEAERLQGVRATMVGEHWGATPGTEVAYRGERFLVVAVDGMFGGVRSKPWLKAQKQKKDGSWSDVVRTVYGEWELAPIASPSDPA